MKMGNSLEDHGGIVGEVTLECFDSEGNSRWIHKTKNLITTVGDNYYAAMAIVGVSPSTPSAPTLVSCMKLGSVASPATDAKTGTGAGIETYVSGSNNAFDSTFPSVSGNVITYTTTWGAGDATNSTLSNVAICFTNADSTSAAADCIARAVISPVRNKQASDTLVATWTHTFLGA
jgi:hypothetical protein